MVLSLLIIGLIATVGLIYIYLLICVIYDILVNREDMDTTTKTLWIIIVLLLNIVGIVLYYLFARDSNRSLEEKDIKEDPIRKIEKLAKLRDEGAISEEEYEEKKEKLLDEI